jgi:phosphoglycerate dehydrogenase-like enzyme
MPFSAVTTSEITVLLLDALSHELRTRAEQELPNVRWVDDSNPQNRARSISMAHVIYGRPNADELKQTANLQWLHWSGADLPESLCETARSRGVVVSKSSGAYRTAAAELAIARLLRLAHRFSPSRILAQSTLALVGVGSVGQSVARLARFLGMRVLGCRRTPRPTPFVDQLFGPHELPAMVRQVDWLVIAIPQARDTVRLVDRSAFCAASNICGLVNLSCRAVLDEDALLAALQSRLVFGAALCDWSDDPFPAGHPLCRMSTVEVVTPVVGSIAAADSSAQELFVRNVHCWSTRAPLEGAVDLELGY